MQSCAAFDLVRFTHLIIIGDCLVLFSWGMKEMATSGGEKAASVTLCV
jgi:hypothetical protein